MLVRAVLVLIFCLHPQESPKRYKDYKAIDDSFQDGEDCILHVFTLQFQVCNCSIGARSALFGLDKQPEWPQGHCLLRIPLNPNTVTLIRYPLAN